jgi:hypothetical protein
MFRAMRELMELVKGPWKIRLYRAGRVLTEMKMKKTTSVPRSSPPGEEFSDPRAAFAALEARAAELLAEGWVDTGVGAPMRAARATQRAPEKAHAALEKQLEKQFALLVKSTSAALRKSTTEAGDRKVWREAIRRFGDLKEQSGGNRDEHLVHFFAVDGVALSQRHPVVTQLVEATPQRKALWLKLLERGGEA